MPTTNITEADLREGKIDILGLLVCSSLSKSRGEARRNVEQGGVTINGEKVTDIHTSYSLEDIKGSDFILKRGKKNFCRITAE